jgi:hypothetical protein
VSSEGGAVQFVGYREKKKKRPRRRRRRGKVINS